MQPNDAAPQPVNEGADAPDLNEPMGQEPQQAVNTPVDPTPVPEQPAQGAPASNATNEGADAPEDDDDDVDIDVSQYAPYRPPSNDLPVNEDGSVDPLKFREQIKQELREEMRFNQQEERTWRALEKKYPQLKGDKDTRELLLNQRIAGAVQGKETNLAKLADRLYSREQAAKSQGRAEATTSTKVQRAASLESNSSNTGDSNQTTERLDRISLGDKAAANDLLTDWLEKGII